MAFEGYAIIGPVSPWDEEHKEAIQMDLAKRTIGSTPAEAWSIHCRRGLDNIDAGEFSRRVQYWHDRGYRVARVSLSIIEEQ